MPAAFSSSGYEDMPSLEEISRPDPNRPRRFQSPTVQRANPPYTSIVPDQRSLPTRADRLPVADSSTPPFWSHLPRDASNSQDLMDQAYLNAMTRPSTSGRDDRYGQLFFSTPPALQQHLVYRLNCASCSTFFTNRGMKVKPHRLNHIIYLSDQTKKNRLYYFFGPTSHSFPRTRYH